MSAISCATKLPSEKPSRSIRSSRIASMKAIASWAIASTVFGVAPVVPPTPTLSNATTRRSAASASIEGGIPVVEVAAEVLQQDERHIALPEVAIGVLDPVRGGDALDRSLGVPDAGCGLSVGGRHPNAPFALGRR